MGFGTEKRDNHWAVLAYSLIFFLGILVPSIQPFYEAQLDNHDSILIDGDSDFIPANGVTTGSGTSNDPYIIENLRIDGPLSYAIRIVNTSKDVVIRNITIYNSGGATTGIHLEMMSNCVVENISGNGLDNNILITGCSQVKIDDGTFKSGRTRIEDSSTICVRNYNVDGGQGSSATNGVLMYDSSDIVIDNCVMKNIQETGVQCLRSNILMLSNNSISSVGGRGIYLREGGMVTVEHNVISNCTEGFTAQYTQGLFVENNTIINNTMDGISLANCELDKVNHNKIENHGIRIVAEVPDQATMEFNANQLSGMDILYLLSQKDRIVTSYAPQYILVGCSDMTIRDIDDCGLILDMFSTRTEIRNCSFIGSRTAISFTKSTGGMVLESSFISCRYGIDLLDSYDVTISNNTFNDTQSGVTAPAAEGAVAGEYHSIENNTFVNCGNTLFGRSILNSRFTSNHISNSSGYGFFIYGTCSDVLISQNYIYNSSSSGLKIHEYLGTCERVTVEHNIVTGNRSHGIDFEGDLNDFLIKNNTISDCDFGLYVKGLTSSTIQENYISQCRLYGLNLQGEFNTIYLNVFNDNSYSSTSQTDTQAVDTSSGTNRWNMTSLGNYWSDYEEKYPQATNLGRTWSTPYQLNSGSSEDVFDYFPLTMIYDSVHPVADAGEDVELEIGSLFQSDGSGSWDDKGIVKYSWNFSDGGQDIILIGPTPTYVFGNEGRYRILLRVEDAWGNRDLDSIFITIKDSVHPFAHAGEDITVDQFDTVILNGSLSEDVGGIVNYTWTIAFPDQTVVLYGMTTDLYCEFAGIFTVELTVIDVGGLHENDTLTLTVRDREPPVANGPEDMEIEVGTQVVLNGTLSSDNVEIINYTWTIVTDEDELTLYGEVTLFTPMTLGFYQASLTVLDAELNSDSASFNISVIDIEPPTVVVPSDVTIDQGDEYILRDQGSTDNDGIINFTWSFNISGTEHVLYGTPVSFIFHTPGVFKIWLTVCDSSSNAASDSFNVSVRDTESPQGELGVDLIRNLGDTISLSSINWTDNVGITNVTWEVSIQSRTERHYGPSVTLELDDTGFWYITLKVSDAEGNQAVDSIHIEVVQTNDNNNGGGDTDSRLPFFLLIISVILIIGIVIFVYSRKVKE